MMELALGMLLEAQQNLMYDFLIPAGLVFLIFWFIFIGPQRKQEKERRKMLEALKKGDEVVTTAGILGKVVNLKEDRVVLKIDETSNTKATFLRSAILNVRKPNNSDKKK